MKLKKISTIISLSLIMACGSAMAADPAPAAVDQGHGTVTFKGAIIEAPCSIAADSVEQTVQLGQVSTAALKGGGTSSPRAFDIKLEGCDTTTKKLVSAAFAGTAKDGNLALMGGTASGATIVIQDSTGADVKINGADAGKTVPIHPGVSLIHFSAHLKGDSTGTIKTGEFTSVSTFSLSYP